MRHDSRAPGSAGLSPREREVLELATLGLSNADIAARLRVTVHAVKFHLSGVYRKLGVANRTEAAVAYTAERGAPATQTRFRGG